MSSYTELQTFTTSPTFDPPYVSLCCILLQFTCMCINVGSSLSLFSQCLITQLQKQYSHVNCRAFSFANRCIDAWNSLDNDVLCASFVQAFKRRLSMCNFTKYVL